jgi:YD repeat-containing protein
VNLTYAKDYLPLTRVYSWAGAGTWTAAYDNARFLTSQTGPGTHSRYFLRDRLGRLTFETSNLVATCPGPTASNLRASYTFTSGASGTQPPDNRLTSAHRVGTTCVPGVTETSVYASGTNRLLEVQRPGTNVNTEFTYDALGRRTMDRDLFDPVQSRRDYTYAPNGRLATISGRTATGTPYTFSLQYDTAGRPYSATKTEGTPGTVVQDLDFYYDDASTLIAARVTESGTTYRWTCFYADGERFGAYREARSGRIGSSS